MTRISVWGGTLLSHGCVSSVYWKLSDSSSARIVRCCLRHVNPRKVIGTTLWNVRHAKDGDLPALDFLDREVALEVQEAVEVHLCTSLDVLIRPRAGVEPGVVIPRDDDLDGVGLGLEPVELGLDVAGGAGVGEVAGVDEDIAGGDGDDLVVGVGDADDADGGLVGGRAEGPAAEEEYEAVEEGDEENDGRGEEVVEEGEGLPLVAAAEADPAEEAHGGGLCGCIGIRIAGVGCGMRVSWRLRRIEVNS